MKLSDALRGARALKNLKQWQVAKVLNVKQQAVSEWEAGGGVDQKHWEGIKEVLGIDVSAYYPPPLSEILLVETSGRRSPITTQSAGRNAFAQTGPISGVGDNLVISNGPPPPEGMVQTDLTPFELSAIETLRDMAPNAASMIIEAIGLFALVGNQMMLQDCLAGLRSEHERYLRKTGR